MKYHLWTNNINGAVRTNQRTKTEPLAKTAKGKKPLTTSTKRSIFNGAAQVELIKYRRQSPKRNKSMAYTVNQLRKTFRPTCSVSPSSCSSATVHNGVNWKISIWLIFLEHWKMVYLFWLKARQLLFL